MGIQFLALCLTLKMPLPQASTFTNWHKNMEILCLATWAQGENFLKFNYISIQFNATIDNLESIIVCCGQLKNNQHKMKRTRWKEARKGEELFFLSWF